MNPEKYNRNINLLCPTCGSSEFTHTRTVDERVQKVTCRSCERELDKEELIRENSENINEHMSEIKKEVVKDVTDELRKSLKKAFSGNKNIRLK